MRKLLAPLLCGLLTASACAREGGVDREALRREANLAVQAENWDAAAASFRKLTEADPGDGDAWHMLGYSLHSGGRIDEALPAHLRATEFPQVASTAAYNAACAYARKGDPDRAFEWLEKAIGFGFAQAEVAEIDPDLETLRADPRFEALVARLRARAGALP
jgi:Flp pilus assembly protein TadD